MRRSDGASEFLITFLATLTILVLLLARCNPLAPDPTDQAQQVRATQAVGDSLVTFEGRLVERGGSYVVVESCDGRAKRTVYGNFILEHGAFCGASGTENGDVDK